MHKLTRVFDALYISAFARVFDALYMAKLVRHGGWRG